MLSSYDSTINTLFMYESLTSCVRRRHESIDL